MNLYTYKWPDGGLSVVGADSREQAATILQSSGPCDPKEVRAWNDRAEFVITFYEDGQLEGDGEFDEGITVGEDVHGWLDVELGRDVGGDVSEGNYPELDEDG